MKAEPNLTPMLDMVLQLVMFFVMVANFKMQDMNQDISLPLASQAKAMDPSQSDLLTLNLDAEGKLLMQNEPPREGQFEIKSFLEREFKNREDYAKGRGEKEANTVVVIRAHSDVTFDKVYVVLREAKLVGFKRWQLRAKIENKSN
jgi:biopolymer transport protein ExbD